MGSLCANEGRLLREVVNLKAQIDALITDAGEEILGPGDSAGFKAGDRDGHHLVNRSEREAVVLEVGGRSDDDACDYPDLDMIVGPGDEPYRHRDGTPY